MFDIWVGLFGSFGKFQEVLSLLCMASDNMMAMLVSHFHASYLDHNNPSDPSSDH
jgi:hypothetical protein